MVVGEGACGKRLGRDEEAISIDICFDSLFCFCFEIPCLVRDLLFLGWRRGRVFYSLLLSSLGGLRNKKGEKRRASGEDGEEGNGGRGKKAKKQREGKKNQEERGDRNTTSRISAVVTQAENGVGDSMSRKVDLRQ